MGAPLAHYTGTLTVDGHQIDVSDWVGSHNHNWGVKQTDHYAWTQVAGFDSHPESFLEMISARVTIGGLRLPMMTSAVLRHRGDDLAFNGLTQLLSSRSSLVTSPADYTVTVKTRQRHLILEASVSAPKRDFVGLTYYNPPGGSRYCLNSKIAACTVTVTDTRLKRSETLSTRHRAAFEIITDDAAHGVAMHV